MLETADAVLMLSRLLAPVSNVALTLSGWRMLFSSLSERVCGVLVAVDFLERLFSFGSLVSRSLGCADCSAGPWFRCQPGVFTHLLQIKISGIFLRFTFAHDKCSHVKHLEHSIIGRAAYGLPQKQVIKLYESASMSAWIWKEKNVPSVWAGVKENRLKIVYLDHPPHS